MSVKIREQRGKLYLDVYQNGVRKWESLHITLSDDKKQNKELYRLAGCSLFIEFYIFIE